MTWSRQDDQQRRRRQHWPRGPWAWRTIGWLALAPFVACAGRTGSTEPKAITNGVDATNLGGHQGNDAGPMLTDSGLPPADGAAEASVPPEDSAPVSGDSAAATEANVQVRTLRADTGAPLTAASVRWYFPPSSSDYRGEQDLVCHDAACTLWDLNEPVSGPIYLVASYRGGQYQNDPRCHYEDTAATSLVADPSVFQQVTLELRTDVAVCEGQEEN